VERFQLATLKIEVLAILRCDASANNGGAQRALLTRVEDALEVRQERVDVSQSLRRLGLVRSFKRAVGKSGAQLQDQFIHLRWRTLLSKNSSFSDSSVRPEPEPQTSALQWSKVKLAMIKGIINSLLWFQGFPILARSASE
jgi:hypothetical protein